MVSSVVRRHSRAILVATVTYFAVTTVGLGLGAYWSHDDRVPSVTVLGSGSRLSLLVVDGSARLLIAGGDDASAFGNALADAVHPTSRRIDVVLIDGDNRSQAVAARVRRDFVDAAVFVIDGDLSSRLADLDLRPENVLSNATHIALSPETGVTIYPRSGGDGWRAEIRRGSTLVIAVSEPQAILPGQRSAVMVFTNRSEAGPPMGTQSRAVILSTGATSVAELREEAALADSPDYAVFVGAGEAARMRFTDQGIELPPRAVALVAAA